MKFSFFSRLAGDPQSVLRTLSEKARIESSTIGATLTLPMVIWAAGGFATASMMNAPLAGCLITGATLAALILILDRGMMSLASKKGRRGIGVTLRFILAFAGSLVFAHPAVFYVARGVIDRELAAEQQTAVEARKAKIAPQLEQARERLAKNLTVMQNAAGGAQTALEEKAKALQETRAKVTEWTKTADDEARGFRPDGQGKAIADEGRNYKRATTNRDQFSKTEAALKDEVEAAQQSAKATQAALLNANAAAAKDPEVLRLEEDLTLALQQIRGTAYSDPFSRFEALHHVMARNWQGGSYSLCIAYIVVCLVLMLMEIVPLWLKLSNGGGELGLTLDQQQFKAEQDTENYKTAYPTFSMDLMQHRLRCEAYREQLKLDNDLAMDRVRVPGERVRLIMTEQAHVFALAEDVMRRGAKTKRREHQEFTERLALQLIAAFQRAVTVEMGEEGAPT